MKNLLIIEDDVTFIEIYRFLFSEYRIFIATNATEAFECLRKQRFQLVISDLNVPEMSGIEIFKNFCFENPKCVAKWVLVTGYENTLEKIFDVDTRGLQKIIISLGFEKYFSKRDLLPQDLKDFVNQLDIKEEKLSKASA